jgi:hypothetical protein
MAAPLKERIEEGPAPDLEEMAIYEQQLQEQLFALRQTQRGQAYDIGELQARAAREDRHREHLTYILIGISIGMVIAIGITVTS